MTERYANPVSMKVDVDALGLHESDAARKAGVSLAVWRAWLTGTTPIPWAASALFRLLRAQSDACKVIGVAWCLPPTVTIEEMKALEHFDCSIRP